MEEREEAGELLVPPEQGPPLLPSGEPPALQLSRVFSKSNRSLQLHLHYKCVPQRCFHREGSDKICYLLY